MVEMTNVERAQDAADFCFERAAAETGDMVNWWTARAEQIAFALDRCRHGAAEVQEKSLGGQMPLVREIEGYYSHYDH